MMKSRNEYYQYIIDEILIKKVCDKFGMLTRPIGEDFVCSCIYHSDPHPSIIYIQKQRVSIVLNVIEVVVYLHFLKINWNVIFTKH